VGNAEDQNVSAFEAVAAVVQGVGKALDHICGHRQVDLAGELDVARGELELAAPPSEVERVDRDTVTAEPGAGKERRKAEGFGRRRVDDFPDVETHALEQHLQLVYEGDIDAAVDVLEQLGRLSDAGAGHR